MGDRKFEQPNEINQREEMNQRLFLLSALS